MSSSRPGPARGDGLELVALLFFFGSLVYRALAQPRKAPVPAHVRDLARACDYCRN